MLGLLLLNQSRKMEDAQQAVIDSERRFRLAVEAACGIWEWDLTTDQMFMSDVTGAISGWGGGVVPGQTCWTGLPTPRAGPLGAVHRRRLRRL